MDREMRIKPEEIDMIKSAFKGNEKLLKVIRKVFLPEFMGDGPIGGQIDIWMTTPLNNQTTEEKLVNINARNLLIQHIETQLLQLKILAETNVKTEEEARDALKKDSNK
jgi:hypothetical protein